VLVLLPPSETKAAGGRGAPLDLGSLSFPTLEPVRRKLVDAVVELAADVPASLAALDLSPRQESEVARNAVLATAPALPALRRYTGVLYDALDPNGFSRAEWRKAGERLAVASALFGLVRAEDRIPAYRLSAGSALPGLGSLAGLWRPALEPVLAELVAAGELVVDLRSGGYAGLARVPGAVIVAVVQEDDGAAGRRVAVSHFNKAHKGRLARALVATRRHPSTVRDLLAVARAAGLRLEQTAEHRAELVV
jgi:cytoplasmic iron level regulating protein YaaA (DUF328/UPF0246 family)